MPQWHNKEEYEEWKASKLKNPHTASLVKEGFSGRVFGSKEKIGFAGIGIMAIGVFLPFVNAPVIGSVTYFGNGEADGIMLLVAAAASLVAILINKMKWLWMTGGWALFTFVLSAYFFQSKMHEIRGSVGVKLAGNPVKQFVDALSDSIQIEVGVPVLIIGILLILTSAYINTKNPN